jgi:hypothetical protein
MRHNPSVASRHRSLIRLAHNFRGFSTHKSPASTSEKEFVLHFKGYPEREQPHNHHLATYRVGEKKIDIQFALGVVASTFPSVVVLSSESPGEEICMTN